MNMSLITAELMLKERHKDLLAEIQKQRMIRLARESHAAHRPSWRIRLGNFLIQTGSRIKGRSGLEARPVPSR